MGRYKSKFNGQEIDNGIEYGVRVTQQTFSSAQKQQARGNIAAQETLVVGTNLDSTPTANSNNPVTSGGVYNSVSKLKSDIDFVRQQLLVDDPDRVIMTTETNPEVLAVCYAQGWCANAGYMTYAEAQAVTDIGNTTFEHNKSITHFEELQYFGITSFQNWTFNGCSNLTSIGIPPSLINFTGSNTFTGCTKLANVYIRDLSKYLCANVSGSYNTDSLPQKANYCYLYINNQRVTTLVIPTDVTTISLEILRRYVFDEVVIPSTHANLSWRYGSGSCYVSKVSVNDTLDNFIGTGYQFIDPRTDSDPKFNANGNIYFNGVKPEGAVTVPNGTTSIGVSALSGLTSVTSVSIPNTVTEIKDQALSKTGITSVTMPDSVNQLGMQVFCDSHITYISTNALGINHNTFSRMPLLETLVLRNPNITSIDEFAYRQANFRNLYLYAQTAPNLTRGYTTPWPYQGTKTLYVPINSTGYDTGRWKECFLDLGWTLSKTL